MSGSRLRSARAGSTRGRSKAPALAFALLVLGGGARARAVAPAGEPAELVTDRPDQTESAVVVPSGALQVETGLLASRDRGGGERVEVLEGPGTLLRWGLSGPWELRAAWSGWIEAETRGAGGSRSRVAGVGDAELGFKLALGPEWAALPELALLAHVSLPVGDEGIGSPRPDPSLRLAAAHTLSERLGLGWNLGLEAVSFEDAAGASHTRSRWIYTAALGAELRPRWGAFVEVFGDLPASDRAPATHSFDGGVTWRATPRVQLDLAGGVGLDGDAPDRFLVLGLSFRAPR